jgi:hypothetical protein
MVDMSKWEKYAVEGPDNGIPAEEMAEYLKDFCQLLREQQSAICEHSADIIEELWERLDEEYKEGIAKGMEIKMDEFAYEISKGIAGRAASK